MILAQSFTVNEIQDMAGYFANTLAYLQGILEISNVKDRERQSNISKMPDAMLLT